METQNEVTTTVIEKKDGDVIATGTATQIDERPGPKTIDEKNAEIKQEETKGKADLKTKGWRSPEDGLQFVSGKDSGVLAWLNPMICEFFGLKDCGYRKALRIWNFPPDLENQKKKHTVYVQSYHQIDGRYLLVDFFDAGTPVKNILLIKAWLESIGYRYTYILGGDMPNSDDPKAKEKFIELIFKTRLAVIDPKSKDFPNFKVPWTYHDAGLQ